MPTRPSLWAIINHLSDGVTVAEVIARVNLICGVGSDGPTLQKADQALTYSWGEIIDELLAQGFRSCEHERLRVVFRRSDRTILALQKAA